MRQNLENYYQKLEEKGYRGKIVNAMHTPELRDDIYKHHVSNTIYPPLYEEYKFLFEFEANVDELKIIRSIFVIAVPVPPYEISFNINDKEIRLLAPPTYLYGRKVINEVQKMLEDILKPEGYNIAYAILPVKTLAVRSGLARYGRNNITYIEGLGSFYRLVPFYSDYPLEEDNWNELKMMDLCKECSACIKKCPTGAIPSEDRFLLRAGRCITFHNEEPPDVPFPDWIDKSWHNCLVGCLHCQKICPGNANVKKWVEKGPSFDEEITRLILKGENFENLPENIQRIFQSAELDNYYEVLPRNLSPFINNNKD